MRLACLVLAAALGPLLSATADAQAWPSRPIRFLVAWPPAGLNDVLARAYNERVSKSLGQPIVLENRPGAGGVVGTTEMAKAAPDGYTLGMGTLGPLTIVPHLRNDLQYTLKSFTPVAMLGISPLVLAVSAETPAKSIPEFIALAKAKPGALNFGQPGLGSTQSIGFEVFKHAAGIDVANVPYKGTPDSLTALLANQTQVMLDTLGPLLPHVRSGKIRALAVTTPRRVDALPEVPTFTELGHADASVFTWHVVIAPAGTPEAILERLAKEYAAAGQSPEVQAVLANQAMMPLPSTRQEISGRLDQESASRRKIITERGIKLQ